MSTTKPASRVAVMRDRDIFQDTDGRVFVVLGFIQPSDRVLSFLKYVRDSDGRWISEGIRYRRMFWGGVDSVAEGMPQLPSSYTHADPHFNTVLIEPPQTVVARYFRPEERLREIVDKGPQDRLEAYVQQASLAIHEVLGIPLENLGVAGSILWKAHNPKSDINMNVYGLKHSESLTGSYERFSELEGFRLRTLRDWRRAMQRVKSRVPALSPEDLQRIFARRRALCIEEQCIGITPVLLPEEVPIQYMSETYHTVSDTPRQVQVRIEDDTYGRFSPALYGLKSEDVERIMVYDGAFSGIFKKGDMVEVSGTLQRIISSDGKVTGLQMMVGTKSGSGQEYIRFKE